MKNKLDDIERMLKEGADVNSLATASTIHLAPSAISEGDTLLHLALWLENRDAVRLLLQFNPNLHISSQDGVTPLQLAIGRGWDDMAVWLIEHGANFNAIDKYGLAPLHYTSSPEIIKIILKKGVAVDLIAHSTRYTPLHYAAYHKHSAKAQVLIDHGAYPNARGKHGETPLHLLMALSGDVTEVGNILIQAGADINGQDEEGYTPLHWALGANQPRHWMDVGNLQGVAYLLEQGARTNKKSKKGFTPVGFAWRKLDKECRKSFKKHGIKPSFYDRVRNLL